MKRGLSTLGLLAALLSAVAQAGEFDRLEGERLASLAKGEGVEHRKTLTLRDLDRLPAIFRDTRSAFLIVKTGKGNYARMLVSPALRKPEAGDAPPAAVLVLERFETFEPGKSGARLARGVGTLLFDGMAFDFDSGQVVPAGHGGDLAFIEKGEGGAAVVAQGDAEVLTLKGPLAADALGAGPTPGKGVVPGDFAGRFRLHADGRWTGLLELDVAPDRQVTGRFRSEANGTTYPVTGEVALDPPNKATFTVKFPRTGQDYEAFLWSEGKNVLAGTFTMTERAFGFFAVREGAKVAGGD